MREQLLDFLKRELVGPDPIPPHIQDNGEEILINEPPRLRYSAGILFPQRSIIQDADKNNQTEQEQLSTPVEVEEGHFVEDIGDKAESGGETHDAPDSTDDILNLANAFLPSAMGFSCFLNIPETGFRIKVSTAQYCRDDYSYKNQAGKDVLKKGYFRDPIIHELNISKSDLPSDNCRSREFLVLKNGKEIDLILNIRNRSPESKWGLRNQLYTFSLINRNTSSGSYINNESCFYQVEFSVKATDNSPCFIPYPEKKSISNDEDEQSNRLLYRNKKTYAIGHGCATFWVENDSGEIIKINTDVLPTHEIKPIIPASFSDIELAMYDLCDCGSAEVINNKLSLLCDKYENWINGQEKRANLLEGELKEIADRHIASCRTCLNRLRSGIHVLNSNPDVYRAFTLMNRSMLMQQLRSNLKLREWKTDDNGDLVINEVQIPDIHDKKSWPDWDEEHQINTKCGRWRPFQIAFILMNLKSIAFPDDHEREIVDLIWFPTGGGKTEAYLGLTAYTIFLKRLRDKSDGSTAVLMRYTLRLLTSQQFQRAASLISACDLIRNENIDELGEIRITIGLWVGQALTPNTRQQAVRALRELSNNQSNENPFLVLKCPWCGSQMGPVRYGRSIRIIGYKLIRRPSTVIYECNNNDCDFSTRDFPLPLVVIDEDIYDSPPTLIIGTVDKFAILPWKPQARTLFGFREEGERNKPPELIIQDELHLISGPLGSMVGHYETLISELCVNPQNGISAKVLTSTATIIRAKQQCNALYNCGENNIFQFPPQCIEAGDSFFAYEDKDDEGRIYAGVCSTSGSSHATTQVRVIAALLQGIKLIETLEEKDRDPYWTVLSYFNSLRELGHAATLVSADIREYLNAMWVRKGIWKDGETDPRRFINKSIELTSRIPGNEIPQALQSLEVSYPIVDNNYPVDICLATNMISVGVDVQRLGLMTVIGQPKTTTEYIQATSRVGRSKEGPGLIVVIYNTSKPRDKSHYEHFHSYHSRIYSQVEPTSVTPFSAPVRERALHAVLVGLVRYLYEGYSPSPQPYPSSDVFEYIESIIKNRISGVDPNELELSLRLLRERTEEWKNHFPPKYGDFSTPTEELQLMYQAGSKPLDEWDGKSWPTPTSMRNVDASCEAKVIGNYSFFESDS